MVRRTALAFALLLLAVSAGCLTTPSPGTDTATATQTPTPTAASPATPPTETPETTASETGETTASGTDCPPHLTVEPASDAQVEDADRTLAFEDLSPERRRAFERALDGGTTLGSDDVDPWVGTVVAYEGDQYAAYVAVC